MIERFWLAAEGDVFGVVVPIPADPQLFQGVLGRDDVGNTYYAVGDKIGYVFSNIRPGYEHDKVSADEELSKMNSPENQ